MEINHGGRAAIVTGGSRGIGLAVATELVNNGATVLITGRKASDLEAAAAELGPACHWRACHVADTAGAQECVNFLLREAGRVDYLINNAGISPHWGSLVEIDANLAAKLGEVNQWAPLFWAQVVWGAWMRDNGGSIVNITSMGGMHNVPYTGYYGSTKAALSYLTMQLAGELSPTVRVNAVAPGMILTSKAAGLSTDERRRLEDATSLGRLGQPQDIATAVSFLLSDHASWITGAVLPVDGGAMVAGARVPQGWSRTNL